MMPSVRCSSDPNVLKSPTAHHGAALADAVRLIERWNGAASLSLPLIRKRKIETPRRRRNTKSIVSTQEYQVVRL